VSRLRALVGMALATVRGVLQGLSLVLAGVGLLGLVAALIFYLLVPEMKGTALTLVALGVLFLLVALLSALGQVRTALVGRRGRYGTNTTVMVVAFLGIAVAANFMGARQHYRFDFTVTREFTLSPKTVQVLEGLQAPVHAVGFLVPGDPTRDTVRNLLREYTMHTDKFSYEIVDPEARPAVARQYEIKKYGTIAFESEGRRTTVASQVEVSLPDPTTGQPRRQLVPNPTLEQDVTAAILKVTGLKQKVVYFLTGHGEADIYDSSGQRGYSLAREGLIPDNYAVKTLSLATVDRVPQDAAVLIVAGPRQDLLEQERPILEDYLRRQGKLLLLADPTTPDSWGELLAPWGLALTSGRVIDRMSYAFPDVATPAVQRSQYYLGPVTKVLDTTFFPEARAVQITLKEPVDTIKVVDLALTTPSSWVETDPGEPKYDEGKDTKGPVFLAAMVEATAPLGEKPPQGQAPQKRTRLVVIGDSDFASNEFFYSLGNSDLFLNSVNWLAEEEELISIRPKPYAYRRLVVTQRAWNWILYSSVAFLPLLVAVAGALTWWRRR